MARKRRRPTTGRRREWVDQRERDRLFNVPSQAAPRPPAPEPNTDGNGTADRPPTKEAGE